MGTLHFLSLSSRLCFLLAEYLDQTDLEEGRENQETNARQEFVKGEGNGPRVLQLLESFSRPGQIPLYYSGGLELLSQAVTDCESSERRHFAQFYFTSISLTLTCFTVRLMDVLSLVAGMVRKRFSLKYRFKHRRRLKIYDITKGYEYSTKKEY